jgi:hypothetical protein
MTKDIKKVKDLIQSRLETLIGELLEQYVLYENKHFATLLYNRARGMHYALKIADCDYSTFRLVDYIWDEARKFESNPAFKNFNASALVEELENLSDKIVDMDD